MKSHGLATSIILLSLILIGCGGSSTPSTTIGPPVDDVGGGVPPSGDVYEDDGEAPIFTSSKTISVMEKTKEVMTVTAEDASLVLYKIVNMDTWGRYFDIDPLSGGLSFKEGSEADYDIAREYHLTISAMDLSRRETLQDITITILDDNEVGSDGIQKSGDTTPPEFVSSEAVSVPENLSVPFHTIIVADVSPVTLSIENLDTWGQYFDLNSTSENAATLSFKSDSLANYEISNEYYLTVKATDLYGNESVQEITIEILDIYEDRQKPQFISGHIANVLENQRTAITVVASDVSPVTYSIVNLDTWGQYFDIDADTGVLTFKEGSEPDYEIARLYYPIVKATDTWDNEATQDIIITIMNVAEDDGRAPVFVSPSIVSVVENRKMVTTLEANDRSTVTYALGDPSVDSVDGQDFEVGSSTGIVSFQDGKEPDYEEGPRDYSFEVQAIDTWGNSSTQTLIIQVLDESIIHDDLEYETTRSPNTGRVWLDRNMEASRVCITAEDLECYGGYYQWGRNSDGHQRAESILIYDPVGSISDVGHDRFISSYFSWDLTKIIYDWVVYDSSGEAREAQWSSVDGGSVCPVGFRVPSLVELEAETSEASLPVQNTGDAFNSFLKIPRNGLRSHTVMVSSTAGFSFSGVGNYASLWTSSAQADYYAYGLYIGQDELTLSAWDHKSGLGVRCIQDDSEGERVVGDEWVIEY